MIFDTRRVPKHLIIHDTYNSPRPRRRSGLWFALATLLLVGSMAITIAARADDLPTEVSSGELFFKSSTSAASAARKSPSNALHVSTRVDATINGLLAVTTYTQHFKNISDDWQEGIYAFPLPEDAAINYMEMRIGERTIVGEIKEKAQARREYQAAKSAGKRAALTEQQRPNFFTQEVANIAPKQDIHITLRYVQNVDYRNGTFAWRLPTTFTPRYIPSSGNNHNGNNHTLADHSSNQQISNYSQFTNGWALPTAQVPDAHKITPPMRNSAIFPVSAAQQTSTTGKTPVAIPFKLRPNELSLNIQLNSGLPLAHIDALYHDINIRKQQGIHHVSLSNSHEKMDRDFVLQWSSTNENTPAAAVFTEQVDNEEYALLMLLPPKQQQHSLPRDVVFIIDTSGSMQGGSIAQAKTSLAMAVQHLSAKDRFNIIEFNSNYSLFSHSLAAAEANTVANAAMWVNRLRADGGTEMHAALDAAFEQFDSQERLQQVVFITDGAVGNEAELFKLIDNKLGNKRLFTVGIGSAPNAYFMRKAADFGRGSFTYIGKQEEIQSKMDMLFNKLDSAASTHINIDWQTHSVQYPNPVGDLYSGEPLIVSAQLGALPTHILIQGHTGDQHWQQEVAVPPRSPSNSQTSASSATSKGIASLWARSKIEQIEDQGITGQLTHDEVKQQVTSVALRHQLLSRFTSFLAVEQKVSRQPEHSLQQQAIANNVAKNQQLSAVMLPQTATNAELAWWLGLFSLCMLILLRALREDNS